MPNKPDKFGIEFWMAVDAETKYLYSSFPYLGKERLDQGYFCKPASIRRGKASAYDF